ncbi:MAG: MoaD/ThiS family protein [Dehalococcoidia bacterium]|nr:MoaD/ThiS family protein [Dehalococcoidia bacterium]
MMVSIKFHGMQRVITNTDGLDMPINGNTKVQDALEYIRQRYPELALEEGMVLITVNHEIAAPDRILKDKDTISILPLIAGG